MKKLLMLLALCVLMGTAAVTAEPLYEIKDGTLYVYDDLYALPDGDYDSISISRNASLCLPDEQQVFQNVKNLGDIISGTYMGDVHNYEDIDGGTFYGTIWCDNHAAISGGTFHGIVNIGEVSNIYGGIFTAASDVQVRGNGEINGGEFSGKVFVGTTASWGGRSGTVNDGVFTETSEVTIGRLGIVNGGTFNGKLYYYIVNKIYGPESSSTVIISVNGTNTDRAAAGKTVHFTVAPEAGYELTSLILTDADENNIAFSKIGDMDYCFTMPASVAIIESTFDACTQVPALPETSDPFSPMLWFAISLLSMAGIVLLRKKKYNSSIT